MGPVVQTVPGMAGANADVDTCSSHDIQVGSVMGPLGHTQRSSLRAAESKGILRAAPASVHASELFSFMPWFKKKKKTKPWKRELSEQLWKMITVLQWVLFAVCLTSRLLQSRHP